MLSHSDTPTSASTGRTSPLWARAPLQPPVVSHTLPQYAQTCVIGAGIAGLSVALAVLEHGRSVVILERNRVASGESGRTSAHLAFALDDRFFELERQHGAEGARLAAASHSDAVGTIERWIQRHRIDCDFARVDGYLFRASGDDVELLLREREAAMRAGVDCLRVDRVAGLEHMGAALRFPSQARFHPTRYLAGLARAVVEAGGVLVEGANAVALYDGAPCRVVLEDGRAIPCGAIVVCTNVPFHRRIAYHTKQAAYRSFVIAARAPRHRFPDALYWDSGDPYHYVRWLGEDVAGHDLLIVGGADRKTGQYVSGDAPFAALETWMRRFCPGAGAIEWRWSGQIIEPVDGLAYVGRDVGREHIYVVTGDSGNGLTHATLAAPLIATLIAGRRHPWQAVYAPARRRIHGTWLRENANAAWQYRDWVAPGDRTKPPLAPGEARVLRAGLHRCAVFRDICGVRHVFSARCPHLGCVVRWNPIERSWDCPCHGSRFDAVDGRVLNGPATTGLAPVSWDGPVETRGE